MLLLNRIPSSLKLFTTTAIAFKLLTTTSVMAAAANQGDPKTAKSIYEFTVNDIDGNPVSLEKYRGHVLLVVNVASKCGYTEQHYKELNELYDEFAESKGLRILAFPCNQFGNQEPGNNEEISCSIRGERKVKFDLFEKIDVNGSNAHPLYTYLKKKQGGTLIDAIKWNFTKFIVDKNGQPVGRYGPSDSPKQIKSKIEKYLDEPKTEFVMAAAANQGDPKTAKSIYEFTVNDIDGNPVSLEKYRGHLLLVVNVASKCGYTEQDYKLLNELYDAFAESKGLRILAFPCNQFGNQEPGNNEEISCSIRGKRKVKFDLFEKIDVNGSNAHPLYTYLKKKQDGTLIDAIKWNFTKFIVDRNGQPVGPYGPSDIIYLYLNSY